MSRPRSAAGGQSPFDEIDMLQEVCEIVGHEPGPVVDMGKMFNVDMGGKKMFCARCGLAEDCWGKE